MRIKSLCLGGEYLSHVIPPNPATYLLIKNGQIVYAGATKNLLARIYKHFSRGLIPREGRASWMCYYWDLKDMGLESLYIKRLRPVGNKNGRYSLIFHDFCEWVEAACEVYFLRKAAYLVARLTQASVTDIKTIWQTALLIERDYLWLSDNFPWHDRTLARWQRVVTGVQVLIRQRATPESLIEIMTAAIAPPPPMPPLTINKPSPGRPKKVEGAKRSASPWLIARN